MTPNLTHDSHKFIAEEIYTGGITKNARITPPGKKIRLNVADSESIRTKVLALYLRDGDAKMGYKVGFTSREVQEIHGINEPEFGFLTSSMKISNTNKVPILGTAQVLVEPEICFELAEGLDGDKISVQQVIDKTRKVYLALEFVETRVGLTAGVVNVIADNVGASRILLSDHIFDPLKFDFNATEVYLEVDDLNFQANVSDVLGNPANSIVWLFDRLSKLGKLGGTLDKGDLVMTGSPVKPIPVKKGSKVKARWGSIGSVEVEMV